MYTIVADGGRIGKMDGDLFQAVLLGLLALGIIVLVALLATLGGIRKAIEQRAAAGSPQAEPVLGSGSGYGASETSASPAAAQHDLTPATQQATTPAAGTGQAETIRGVLQQHGLQGAQQAAPAAQEPAPQEHVVDSVFAAHADDPQEEPFQRDGRWWFRRGDELLLYDEATGQWQPAPAEGGAGTTTAPTPSGAAQSQSTQATATATATPAVADQVATYWKCPTCGAVNGSTAATCRMCFAARP